MHHAPVGPLSPLRNRAQAEHRAQQIADVAERPVRIVRVIHDVRNPSRVTSRRLIATAIPTE